MCMCACMCFACACRPREKEKGQDRSRVWSSWADSRSVEGGGVGGVGHQGPRRYCPMWTWTRWDISEAEQNSGQKTAWPPSDTARNSPHHPTAPEQEKTGGNELVELTQRHEYRDSKGWDCDSKSTGQNTNSVLHVYMHIIIPGFDPFQDKIFPWNIRNLVIYIPRHKIITASPLLSTCGQLCLEFSD